MHHGQSFADAKAKENKICNELEAELDELRKELQRVQVASFDADAHAQYSKATCILSFPFCCESVDP